MIKIKVHNKVILILIKWKLNKFENKILNKNSYGLLGIHVNNAKFEKRISIGTDGNIIVEFEESLFE